MTTAPFTGQVSTQDASGDAASNALRPASPDVTRFSAAVDGTTLTLTWSFAAGTFELATSCAVADLDIDALETTGERDLGLGVDYQVQAYDGKVILSDVRARLSGTVIGRTPTVNGDTVTVTMPLAAFGNDDGRMAIRAKSVVLGPASFNSGPLDYAPDATAAALRLQ